MAKQVIITATKSVKGRRPSVTTETVESFGACSKRLKELAAAWGKSGFTFNPTSRVDFDAIGWEEINGTKRPVLIRVIARYAEGESRVVTDRPSIVLTNNVRVAA